MNICPKCTNGKMTITMTMGWPSQKDAESSVTEIECVHCDGTGEVSDEELDDIMYEDNMWCKCGDNGENVKYLADGEHEVIHQHHWRCRKCDGVVQIG